MQNKRIDGLLAAHGGMPGSLLVTGVVLVEAVWTLASAVERDKLVSKHARHGCRPGALSTRYSITSSARSRIACETVTPNARAVARLNTSS